MYKSSTISNTLIHTHTFTYLYTSIHQRQSTSSDESIEEVEAKLLKEAAAVERAHASSSSPSDDDTDKEQDHSDHGDDDDDDDDEEEAASACKKKLDEVSEKDKDVVKRKRSAGEDATADSDKKLIDVSKRMKEQEDGNADRSA